MSSASATQPKYLSSFGRNRGRALRPYQEKLVDELLPMLTAEIVPGFKRYALEIGFGGGEHLAAQAKHNPDTLYIGCEPYINGVAKLLVEIDKHKLKNVRIYARDVRELLERLPDKCLDEIFILFPDPWPKVRHNKRRLVNQQTLSMLSRLHKANGRLLVATDHIDYSAWILEHLTAHPDYEWKAERVSDWLTPPKDWTVTKYQRKTTEQGREPQFFECVRA